MESEIDKRTFTILVLIILIMVGILTYYSSGFTDEYVFEDNLTYDDDTLYFGYHEIVIETKIKLNSNNIIENGFNPVDKVNISVNIDYFKESDTKIKATFVELSNVTSLIFDKKIYYDDFNRNNLSIEKKDVKYNDLWYLKVYSTNISTDEKFKLVVEVTIHKDKEFNLALIIIISCFILIIVYAMIIRERDE